jgi:hypothetical protein
MRKTQTVTLPSTRKRVLLLIAAAALLVALMIARHCAGLNVLSVDPIVSLERSQPENSPAIHTASAARDLLDDGEVYRTADRLREASALTLAAGIYIANESAASRSLGSAEEVTAGVRSAGLLPPGVAPAPGAMLLSNHSRLFLRFRPEPLAVEVLSFPRSREDGPALMTRIPGLGNDADRGSVFIADRLGDIDPPPPFASLADCVRAGWIDQRIDQEEIPVAEQQQLRAWLATRRRR